MPHNAAISGESSVTSRCTWTEIGVPEVPRTFVVVQVVSASLQSQPFIDVSMRVVTTDSD